MFAVLAILAWALIIGLRARRFGGAQQALLVAGILVIITIQFSVFGPS